MSELDALEPSDGQSLQLHSGNDAIDRRLNVDQMLSLIDSVLPFEACLFHQVIPLSIEADRLNLGMVTPGDTNAMAYVRRQVSYIKYAVVAWPITSDWHRQMLSKYLSYAAKVKPRKSSLSSGQTPSWPTAPRPPELDDCLTLVVDSPEEITVGGQANHDIPPTASSAAPPAPSRPETENSPAALPPSNAAPNLAPTTAAPPPSPAPAPEPETTGQIASSAPIRPSAPVIYPVTAPLELDITEIPRAQEPNDLRTLPPKLLMQTLLGRVLVEGIGRLYFERQPQLGRVLCSQDGVLGSVVEDIRLDLFQSVINELKRLAHLPMLPITKTRQVDIERLYRHERVLLRLRLIAGTHGEEATLQVLRGAALKFYQQQQIEQMGRDALSIAQTLQQRINAIRDQARRNLSLEPTPTATLLTVNSMLKEMEAQIAQMLEQQNPDHPP